MVEYTIKSPVFDDVHVSSNSGSIPKKGDIVEIHNKEFVVERISHVFSDRGFGLGNFRTPKLEIKVLPNV